MRLFLTFIILISFIIGLASDIGLQLFSKTGWIHEINLLDPFWEEYGPIKGALAAGLTTMIAGTLAVVLALVVFNWLNLSRKTYLFILVSVCIGFLIGVFGDIWINRSNLFGHSLRMWYDGVGENKGALWGGIAIAFVVLLSTIIPYVFNV